MKRNSNNTSLQLEIVSHLMLLSTCKTVLKRWRFWSTETHRCFIFIFGLTLYYMIQWCRKLKQTKWTWSILVEIKFWKVMKGLLYGSSRNKMLENYKFDAGILLNKNSTRYKMSSIDIKNIFSYRWNYILLVFR